MADARRNRRNYAPAGAHARNAVRTLVIERKRRKLQVEDIAELTGYSIDHVKKVECGQRHPGFNMLASWAQALRFEIVLRRKR